jgi:hypothetical protein
MPLTTDTACSHARRELPSAVQFGRPRSTGQTVALPPRLPRTPVHNLTRTVAGLSPRQGRYDRFELAARLGVHLVVPGDGLVDVGALHQFAELLRFFGPPQRSPEVRQDRNAATVTVTNAAAIMHSMRFREREMFLVIAAVAAAAGDRDRGARKSPGVGGGDGTSHGCTYRTARSGRPATTLAVLSWLVELLSRYWPCSCVM